ncbi:MAG: S8 family serine peptidase, partial [Chloroflexota bacterium]
DGNQTLVEIADKGFVRAESTGNCQLERNHAALSTTGIDVVRMAGYTGNGIPVAVIDSGFLPTHTEYSAQIMSAASYTDANADFVLDAGEKAVDDYDVETSGHGTGVTGQVVGQKAGVATRANIHLKGLHENYPISYDEIIAVKEAVLAEAIPVVSLSTDLGTDFLMYRSQYSYDETGLFAALSPTGSVMVFAAGNSGADLSWEYDMGENYDPTTDSFFEHADEADNVLFVGAYDQDNNELAAYSNYPGYRASFQERFIVSGDFTFETASNEGDSAFSVVSGTSYATPQVSGALAILMEAKPGLTAVEAAQILLDTAKQLPEWGYGKTCSETTELGTFSTDCGAMKFGRGLMDLPAALEAAAAI